MEGGCVTHVAFRQCHAGHVEEEEEEAEGDDAQHGEVDEEPQEEEARLAPVTPPSWGGHS